MLDGKPLSNAKIEFIPTDNKGQRVSAQTNARGDYLITQGTKTPGIKAGKYKVSVTTVLESPDENVIDLLEEVPAKYNSKTTLNVTVVRGIKNSYNITLMK